MCKGAQGCSRVLKGVIERSRRRLKLLVFIFLAFIFAAKIAEAEPLISIQERPEVNQKQITNSKKYTENYATDSRLVDYVMDRIVLPNGLIVRRWRWTTTAKTLGLDQYPNFGFIAQDVQAIYPDLVFENTRGYLVFDRQKLIVKDKFVRELSSICGFLYGCSKYRRDVLMKKQK